MTTEAVQTVDSEGVALFGALASDWWDPDGRSKLLHRINPVRLGYVHAALTRHFERDAQARGALDGLAGLDIGCGGGLLTEPLARMGAQMDGLDAGAEVIAVARAHAAAQDLAINYVAADAVSFAATHAQHYDFISCLEVMEHVIDLASFLEAIAAMLKPGGLLLFSTPNRTWRSWAALIFGAEQVLKLIPDGGHDWSQLITPAELRDQMARAGLAIGALRGLSWSPARGFHISADTSVNYIGTATLA